MINISFNFLQLVAVVFVIVIACILGNKFGQVLLKIIFSSKPVMAWNMRRQLEQKKLQKKTELQQTEESIKILEQFVEWIDKTIQGADKKQFWREFHDKQTRLYWIKTIKDIIAREKQQIDAPKPVMKVTPTNENGHVTV